MADNQLESAIENLMVKLNVSGSDTYGITGAICNIPQSNNLYLLPPVIIIIR